MTSSDNRKSKTRASAAVIFFCSLFILCGVFFRFYKLDSKGVWHDEILTHLHVAGFEYNKVEFFDGQVKPVSQIKAHLIASKDTEVKNVISSIAYLEPVHPPAYYILAYYLSLLIGQSSESLRGLAAFLGLFQIPLAFLVARQIFNEDRVAWLAAAFVALSPVLVLYSQEAREYSVTSSLFLLSTYLFLKATENKNLSSWIRYIISVTVGFYTSSFLFIVSASQLAYSFVEKEFRAKKTYIWVLIGNAISLLIYLPWLVIIYDNQSRAFGCIEWLNSKMPFYDWLMYTTSGAASTFFDPGHRIHLMNEANIVNSIIVLFVVGIQFLSLLTLLKLEKKNRVFVYMTIALYLAPFILPDLLSGGIRTIFIRYLLPISTLMCLVVAYAFFEAASTKNKPKKVFCCISLLVLICCLFYSDLVYAQSKTWHRKIMNQQDLNIVSKLINSKKGRVLIVTDSKKGSNLHQILALSLLLKNNINVQSLRIENKTSPASEFDHIFLFDVCDQTKDHYHAQGFKLKPLPGQPYLVEIENNSSPRKSEYR